MENNYVKELPFYSSLNQNEIEFLKQSTIKRHYKKSEIIHGCNGSCLGMVYVLTGNVRTYMLSEEGREITLFTLSPGEPCVLSAACVVNRLKFHTFLIAEEESDLLIVNAKAFAKLAENNIYVKCFLYETATDSFSSVMCSMQLLLFKSIDKRLAAFLVGQCDKLGTLKLNMTHDVIAQNISSAREVVARTLKRFSQNGYVEVGRGNVTVKNIEALRKLL